MEHKTRDFPFSLKAATAAGQFSGMASVYRNVDSYGDVVMPGAFARSLAMSRGRVVILNQHNSADPIGSATVTDTGSGLHCSAQLELGLQSAREAYVRLKAGLITGLSIGFTTVRERRGEGGIRELTEVDLWEVSLVTFPANDLARVTDVKRSARSRPITPEQLLLLRGTVRVMKLQALALLSKQENRR